MRICGIHDGHNASACLLQDGVITHAVQEERLTGIKNQGGFPSRSIAWILKSSGLEADDVDHWVFGMRARSPAYSRDELVEAYKRQDNLLPRWEFNLVRQRNAILRRLGAYDAVRRFRHGDREAALHAAFPGIPVERVESLDHHLCHAASAYYLSPWVGDEALVLTLDGSGDNLCATVSIARDGKLERIAATPDGHSVGNIYARMTARMGFVPLEHEYKLMGMGPYCDPESADSVSRILERYIEVRGLEFHRTVPEHSAYMGRRMARDLKYERFDSLAGGVQLFTERLVVQWVRNAIAATGRSKLCLAGGVFMNIKVNGLISQLDTVEDVFITPSCGDDTLSFGAAAIKYAEAREFRQMPSPIENLYLGPDITAGDVESTFGSGQLESEFELERPSDPAGRVAELLADGEIVARCYGPTEFGARALGNRSIFADPSRAGVIHTLNDMVKMRDFWMPFAPVVKRDRQGDYLINKKNLRSPFMMLGFDTKPERRWGMNAAIHPRDHSARPQILEQGQNADVENLLDAFERRTGRAVLLNTSFNIHGDPIVANLDQALDVLRNSGLKYLWAGQVILRKKAG